MRSLSLALAVLMGNFCGTVRGQNGPESYFRIQVVDEQTGRGVPLVELRTVSQVRYLTDSSGQVAFFEPGLMGRAVYFSVSAHGYAFPADRFKYRGVRLQVEAGGKAVLKLRRLNVAQRLYRMTGAGVYRDSVMLGDQAPIKQPVLNGQVFGSDSVVNAIYRDRIYWFWGDTNRPSYPLGNFHVPGATSLLPSAGGLDPNRGVDLEYFVEVAGGFAKPTAQMPGQGPTWINGLVVVPDVNGQPRMLANYVKVAKPMRIYERGLVEFDDEGQRFTKHTQFDMKSPLYPTGHPTQHRFQDTQYVLFNRPYPLIRARATAEAVADVTRYESFTCLVEGSREDKAKLDRNADGTIRYAWKKDTSPLTLKLQKQLVRQGHMRAGEGLYDLRDMESGKPVAMHGGSVYWNAYRRRWIMIALESFGSSLLGEIWFSEAHSPLGPWAYARKIVTHDKYSFYNPKQHPMLDQQGGRIIYFEGTYTNMFSGNPDKTPWYNYNQIMYKLDLADPRLSLPVAVYQWTDDADAQRYGTLAPAEAKKRGGKIVFCALDRPRSDAVPVVADGQGLQIGSQPGSEADAAAERTLFYALPAMTTEPPPATVELYACSANDGGRAYVLEGEEPPEGFTRSRRPCCRVWRKSQLIDYASFEPL